MNETIDKDKLLEQVETIYKEIAEEDKRLCEDFLSISVETIERTTF
jgi:hypothetical protein